MNIIFKDLAVMCPLDADEEIAKHYKTEPEHRDMFVAKIYTKYVNYLGWYRTKTYLSDEDKESILLETIHTVLTNYDETRGVLFKTVLATYLKSRFRYEDEYLFAKSRNWYMNTTFASGQVETDEGNGAELLDLLAGGKEDDHSFEMEESLKTLPLSENQYRYCQYVMSQNYIPTDTEASKALGISKSGIRVIKEYLKEKLADLL